MYFKVCLSAQHVTKGTLLFELFIILNFWKLNLTIKKHLLSFFFVFVRLIHLGVMLRDELVETFDVTNHPVLVGLNVGEHLEEEHEKARE